MKNLATIASPDLVNDAVLSAVWKAVPDAERPTLEPGSYVVDAVVHVRGTLKQAAPFEKRVANKVDFELLFAVALSKLNAVTAESVRDVVREAMAARDNPDSPEAAALRDAVDGIKGFAKAAIDEAKEATWTKCRGALTGDVACEVVQSEVRRVA